MWGNVEQRDLADLGPDTIDQAHTAAETGLNRIGTGYDMCMAFLNQIFDGCGGVVCRERSATVRHRGVVGLTSSK